MKNITKNILLLLASTLLCLILLEVFLRVYNTFEWRIRKNEIVLPVNRKYVFRNTGIHKLDKEILHTKNSLGFRGEEPPADFDKYLSIIVVGGSTTECFYLSDYNDWPCLVGEKLKKALNRIWLNNAGFAGHSTFGHIILVRDYLAKLRPTIIMFAAGANDIGRSDLSKYDKVALKGRYSSIGNFIVKNSEVVSLFANVSRLWKAKKLGVTHKNLELAESDTLEISPEDMNKELAEHRAKYVSGYKKRLLKLAEISRENGIEPIFITQPQLCGDAVDRTTGVNLGNIKLYESMNGRLSREILELYNDAAREVAASTGSFLIDLSEKMPKDSLYFYDNWHYTNEGAEKVSEIVYAELRDYLSEKYKSFVKEKKGDL